MPRPAPRSRCHPENAATGFLQQALKGNKQLDAVTAEIGGNYRESTKETSQVPLLSLWKLIIRPRRCVYLPLELGPENFVAGGKACVRRDTSIRTSRGFELQCSYYRPRSDEAARDAPVLVYLHGNSGSRLESVELAVPLLQSGISLFSYDAAGCGLSEGDYVSLGWHETEDLAEVLQSLRRGDAALGPPCGPVALWGRSMGAVTALLHAGREETSSPRSRIVAMCLDSPFGSLRQLASELAQSEQFRKAAGFTLPTWLFETAFALIRLRVQALADFDMEEVAPLTHAPQTSVPVFFIHGRSDRFIEPCHSKQIFEAYGGTEKTWKEVDGTHNTPRDQVVLEEMLDFLVRIIQSLPSGVCSSSPGAPEARGSPPAVAPSGAAAKWRGGRRWPLPPPKALRGPPQQPANHSPKWEPMLPNDEDDEDDKSGANPAGETPRRQPWEAAVPQENKPVVPRVDWADISAVHPRSQTRFFSSDSMSSEAPDVPAMPDDDAAIPQVPRRHPLPVTTDFRLRSGHNGGNPEGIQRSAIAKGIASPNPPSVKLHLMERCDVAATAAGGEFGPQPPKQLQPERTVDREVLQPDPPGNTGSRAF